MMFCTLLSLLATDVLVEDVMVPERDAHCDSDLLDTRYWWAIQHCSIHHTGIALLSNT